MDASHVELAPVRGAWIPVVTGAQMTRNTFAGFARIADGAGISVFAQDAGKRLAIAPGFGITQIQSANIVVVAVCMCTRSTYAVVALVTPRAEISVLAESVVIHIHTADLEIARFVRTIVAIIAVLVCLTPNRSANPIVTILVTTARIVACATVRGIGANINACLTTRHFTGYQPLIFAGDIISAPTPQTLLTRLTSRVTKTAVEKIPINVNALTSTIHQPISTLRLFLPIA
jgi:hypothetical protein